MLFEKSPNRNSPAGKTILESLKKTKILRKHRKRLVAIGFLHFCSLFGDEFVFKL